MAVIHCYVTRSGKCGGKHAQVSLCFAACKLYVNNVLCDIRQEDLLYLKYGLQGRVFCGVG